MLDKGNPMTYLKTGVFLMPVGLVFMTLKISYFISGLHDIYDYNGGAFFFVLKVAKSEKYFNFVSNSLT